jgi:sterol desaturase/sphingolipid hydroxylase (fatty acid hydroxylase superfamily)
MISLDPDGYFFWLIIISVLCFALERTIPSRPAQSIFREGFGQDLLWLLVNGAFIGAIVALPVTRTPVAFLAEAPILVQLAVALVLKDFIDWCAHYLMHRVPWLWQFHKVHHTLEELDSVGSFRFHFVELALVGLAYVPLFLLGIDERVLLATAVFGTLVSHLSHSNLRLDWGPLSWILITPQFHAWHHRRILHGERGANFAVVLCIWDRIFGTVDLSTEEELPDALGFEVDDYFPATFLERFTYPLSRWLGRSS